MGELSTNEVDLIKFAGEKIEKATGFLFDPYGTKRESRQQLVSRIKSLNLPPLEEAALISKASKIIKEYINQNDIIRIALDDLNSRKSDEPPKIDDVDDEFLSRFFESAKHVSSEEVKLIWGHILANEFAVPNSIPKPLIHIMSIISAKQAEFFATICQHSLLDYERSYIPFVDYNLGQSLNYWKEKNISYETLLDLKSLGLISFMEVGYYSEEYNLSLIEAKKIIKKYKYNSYLLKIDITENVPDENNFIKVFYGTVLFTNAGLALAKSINIDYSDKAFEHIVNFLKEQNFKVDIWKETQ